MENREQSSPFDSHSVNRLEVKEKLADLLPKTTVKRLLSEEQAQLEEVAQREFEALGAAADKSDSLAALYPVLYEQARQLAADGRSQEDLRKDMTALLDDGDADFSNAVRLAYEDALADRPARFGADQEGITGRGSE